MSTGAPWRYLTADGVAAAAGLATDEALLAGYGRGAGRAPAPTLRLYTYRPHCALVGRYQSLEDEVDVAFCETHGLDVGRRPTGGGAILMGPGQLGVAVAARAATDETPRQTLRRWAEGVVAGLARLGIAAGFRRKNDLEVEGRKIAGLGLYLDPAGAVLFHASLLVDLDVELMLGALRIPGLKVSDKAVARVEERVTTVSRRLGRRLAAADVRAELARGFADVFTVALEPGELTPAETERRAELLRERYANPEWVFQRGPRRSARGSALLKTPAGLVRIFVGVQGPAITSVLVTGDFNLVPVGVPRLEAALKWCAATPEAIAREAERTLAEGDLGVPAERVAAAIWEAAAQAMRLEGEARPDRDGACYFPEPVTAGVREAVPSGEEGG